ncbi:response regulator [Niveispirillum irakense]|uniref:response regulator n=1 Tax=Niveispirillum irakense TaxID=34011 RepID=UPI00040C6322|nr:response regulator [Niveispirillum irakense]
MQIGVETTKAVDQRRVFVVDADEVTRAALQFMLHDEIETHELSTPEEAYAKGIDWLRPDLVLLGASFIATRGAGLVGEFQQAFPGVRLLITCAPSEEAEVVKALAPDIHGVLLKPLTLEAVRRKVDTVLCRCGAAPLIPLGMVSAFPIMRPERTGS